ncbi:hypothetical protein NliqN6_0796 [Naganishia liquefaciens]|uniref:FHA domain-containing protein n=1 Tax=Naganishia liquefaciens TaxID=104408 RepID=A0A8H3TQC9_9TREE|nr:hypothetical protein NliqN6_0796 [Naganishia liquefaciens]
MRAAPIPTRSRSSTTSAVPSRPSNAPTHIALPAAPSSSSWTNNAFAAFGAGRQNGSSAGGGGSASGSARDSPAGTPGSLPGTPASEVPALQRTPSARGTEQQQQQHQRPVTSPSSPRSGFLPNFIQRTRARSSTLSGRRNQGSAGQPTMSGSTAAGPAQGQAGNGLSPGAGNGGRETPVLTRSVSSPAPHHNASASPRVDAEATRAPSGPTYRIRLVPHLETYRSLHFEPVVRDLEPCAGIEQLDGTVLKIGRFTEKQSQALQQQQQQQQQQHQAAAQPLVVDTAGPSFIAGTDGDPAFNPFTYSTTTESQASAANGSAPLTSTVLVNGFPLTGDRPATGMGGGGHLNSAKVAFKSKVVSRAHAEIWCEAGGKFFVRDTKSSSGTFLNHIRLSNPNTESRPYPIKDGDIIQLGVDYQGGTEEMYRCVKMKIEVGRERQRGQNNFNKEAMKQLRALGGVPESPTASTSAGSMKEKKPAAKASVTDCCICLFSVTVQQALFIAPCSHVFHYKCIRPMLQLHHPGFACPLCRTFHDLEADVELDDAWDVASRRASVRRESAMTTEHDILMSSIGVVEPAASAAEPVEVTARDTSDQAADDLPSLSAPLSSAVSAGAINDDFEMSEEASAASNNDAAGNTLPVTSSARQTGMSLGGLPIPRFNDPATLNNPEYVGLDAATPMNTTFLSTLADSPMTGSLSGLSINGLPRGVGRLDDVGEEEVDDVPTREPEEHLYT